MPLLIRYQVDDLRGPGHRVAAAGNGWPGRLVLSEGVQDARRLAGRAVQRKVGALCGKLGIDPADLSLLGGDASMLT